MIFQFLAIKNQPPSGGCVLKRLHTGGFLMLPVSAAFGRLCVETAGNAYNAVRAYSAAFGRLCVETEYQRHRRGNKRLSRLRAAVC